MNASLRFVLLLLAFAFGMVFHAPLAPFKGLIPWSLGLMLLISYLGLHRAQIVPRWAHFKLLFYAQISALLFYLPPLFLGWPVMAEGLFYCAAAPIATASPVIISLLGRDVGFMTTAMLISQLIFGLSVPLILPVIVGETGVASWDLSMLLLSQMAGILLLPALIAYALRKWMPSSKGFSTRFNHFSLYLWMVNIIIITAAGFDSIASMDVATHDLCLMLGMSALVCLCNFSLGSLLGRPHLTVEFSQGLGQKNTMLTLFVASQSFGSPLAYLAPAFYVFFHNVVNMFQITRVKRKIK